MMTFPELLALLQSVGLPALIVALAILALVYIARYSKLLPTGNWARAANIVLAFLLTGAGIGDSEAGLTAALASVFAALLHEIVEAITKKIKK